VRLRELFESAAPTVKKLGRTFNHLEDLVFFYGTSGTMEALEHLKEVGTQQGASTIRMKWDGNPQIYWGREYAGGPLILAGHNGWLRGAKTDNPKDIVDFITNKSGKPKTPEEQKARQQFAQQFANLYPLFDKATPKDFEGFVYADGLFLQQPVLDETGVYNFCPNPKSKTCYHVMHNSELGQRIANAQVMVVGHAFFPEFGMPDDAQQPLDDFDQFNINPKVIVLGPIYNVSTITVDTKEIDQVEQFLGQHSQQIDTFIAGVPGLSDLKEIIYTYVNQTAKAKQLDSLSPEHFASWLATSKVSAPKQQKILDLANQQGQALPAIFELVKRIQTMKDHVIDQLEAGPRAEIWDTHGEGRVRYSGSDKKHGHVKFVPRKRWTPS
jgi:hypothetical protein